MYIGRYLLDKRVGLAYLCRVIKNNYTMDTITTVMQTKAFQQANNMMVISPSLIGIFENAINFKNAGWTYDQWLQSTCAGTLSKAIVKEIFEA